ncbi:MAG: MarR family transcriptional regulator [Coraliomargarita sp. TMED73]|nr:MAG: MarR family transcriptional regulator [Coraliomargarita sp. TMED73]
MGKIYQHSGTHLFLLFWRAYHTVMRFDRQSMKRCGFASLSDFAVLEVLRQQGPQPVKSLGEKVMLTSGSITTAVQRLEKKGLVQRTKGQQDGRLVLVELTESGRTRILEGFLQHNEDLDRLYAPFNEEERALFDRLMTRLGQQAEDLLAHEAGNKLEIER